MLSFHILGRFILSILGAMLALLGGMAPSAAELVVRLPATTGSIDLDARNEQQFRTGFRIGLAIDPSSLGQDELQRAIDSLALTAPNGLPLRQRAVSAKDRIVIGVTTPGVAPVITSVTSRDGQTMLMGSFRDQQGRYVLPPDGSVGVFDLRGAALDHQLMPFTQSGERAYIDLLLDRSGSMDDVIRDVESAASAFMARLPKQTVCRVTSFNGGHVRHTPDYLACVPGLHGVAGLRAEGGTDIYTPLRLTYVDGPGHGEPLRLVLVVSDGVGRSSTNRQDVLAAKGSSSTHVYWLGDYDESRLDGIADTFIYGQNDMDGLLVRYFGAISDAISNQVIITFGGKETKP